MNVVINVGEPFTSKVEGVRKVRLISFTERVSVADAVEDKKEFHFAFFIMLFKELGWSDEHPTFKFKLSDEPDNHQTFVFEDKGVAHYVCFHFSDVKQPDQGDWESYNKLTFGRFEANNWAGGIRTPMPNISYLWKYNDEKHIHRYMNMYLDLFRKYWNKYRKSPNTFRRKLVLVGDYDSNIITEID